MKRRDFLRVTATAGAGLTLPGGVRTALEAVENTRFRHPDLAVVKGESPAKITRAAVDALGGMKRFISRGDIVVVKPNIGWDRTPEQGANTNPEVVAALVRMCFEAGAKTVKVFDRPCNDPRRCYVQSGIAEAARAQGADVSFINDRKFKDTAIHGEILSSWPLYRDVLEADKIINVPIAKHHGLAGLTLSLKNWMGVMGGRRGRIHQRIDTCLVDLALVLKPTLTVLDAVRILTGNGPQGGSLKDVKRLDTVVAGTDQVAIDAFGATFFGMKGRDLGFVREGARRGIGTMELSKLAISRIGA
ncbi:MAG: DUF362 domain-containing protein [Acidobacteriota bacterium]|jgi:uncharacterized protein (DUF362 family)